MLHLRDKADYSMNFKSTVCIDNINEIVILIRNKEGFVKNIVNKQMYHEFLKNKIIFSDGAVRDLCFLKMLENCDFNEYVIESSEFIGTFIDSEELKIDTKSDYLFLYNEDINLMIPIVHVKEDDDEYYKIYVDKLICVKEYLLQKCDGCSCVSLKELLFNLYPEINTGLNKKYENFKGMVCGECLSKMEKGLTLKNEEELREDKGEGDVTEKIDEFSSIEDILKFCGMDSKDELAQELKNKIYH